MANQLQVEKTKGQIVVKQLPPKRFLQAQEVVIRPLSENYFIVQDNEFFNDQL